MVCVTTASPGNRDYGDWMTLGEANWILWGLALQVGLCPLDRSVLVQSTFSYSNAEPSVQHCLRCHRDWYLWPRSGRCAGWWLTPDGWYYTPEGKVIFR